MRKDTTGNEYFYESTGSTNWKEGEESFKMAAHVERRR